MLKLGVKNTKFLKVVDDSSWVHVIHALNVLEKSYVKVGFPENGKLASSTKKGSDHKPATAFSEIIMIAAFNEFGTDKIPERPFIRQSFDNNLKGLNDFKEKLYIRVVKGQLNASKTLGLLGEWMLAATKREIRNGNFTELSDYTKQKKGTNKTLIDTAQMLNSLQYDIVIIK